MSDDNTAKYQTIVARVFPTCIKLSPSSGRITIRLIMIRPLVIQQKIHILSQQFLYSRFFILYSHS